MRVCPLKAGLYAGLLGGAVSTGEDWVWELVSFGVEQAASIKIPAAVKIILTMISIFTSLLHNNDAKMRLLCRLMDSLGNGEVIQQFLQMAQMLQSMRMLQILPLLWVRCANAYNKWAGIDPTIY